MGGFSCSLCAEPGNGVGDSHGSANALSIASLFAIKPHLFSELSVLGAHPLSGSLKVGVLCVVSKPFAPLGRIWELGAPSRLYVTGMPVGFMMRVECVSAFTALPVWMWVFSHSPYV